MKDSVIKKIKIIILFSLLCSLIAIAVIGCDKEGPMEKAGKKVDEAVDSTKEAVDK